MNIHGHLQKGRLKQGVCARWLLGLWQAFFSGLWPHLLRSTATPFDAELSWAYVLSHLPEMGHEGVVDSSLPYWHIFLIFLWSLLYLCQDWSKDLRPWLSPPMIFHADIQLASMGVQGTVCCHCPTSALSWSFTELSHVSNYTLTQCQEHKPAGLCHTGKGGTCLARRPTHGR